MSIGKRLKQVRNHFKLNKEQFSMYFGISAYELTSMENSKKNICYMLLIKLEEMLGVDPGWLITGKGKMLRERDQYVLRERIIKMLFFDKEMSPILYKTVRNGIEERAMDVSLKRLN